MICVQGFISRYAETRGYLSAPGLVAPLVCPILALFSNFSMYQEARISTLFQFHR